MSEIPHEISDLLVVNIDALTESRLESLRNLLNKASQMQVEQATEWVVMGYTIHGVARVTASDNETTLVRNRGLFALWQELKSLGRQDEADKLIQAANDDSISK